MIAAAAGLVLSGCGNESDGGAGNPPPSQASSSAPGTPSGTPTVTQSTPVGAGLPLRVSRTGGFAGFDDQVLIDTDGVATVSSRGKDPVRCKLDPTLLATITTAAQQVDWASVVATKPTAKHPDDMIIAVSANGKTARIEDPKLKPLTAPVSKLLTEAAIPPGKLCKPV
ncbi:hypothetical protein AB0L70_33135 [Kribbella sp. NPDC051952]|uniref:hypothetical protein n=1 Tax=Kribbella sp. NPDC051952 TaxID=3154851 RepID=UPI00342EA12C